MNKENKSNNRIILNIFLSVLFSSCAFLGFFFLSRIDYEDIIRLPFFLYVIPFILLGFFYYKRLSLNLFQDKRKLILSIILSFLFALSLIAGYQLRISIALASGLKGKLGIIIKSVMLSFTFIPFFELLFALSNNDRNETIVNSSKADNPGNNRMVNRLTVFFVSWAVVFISWFPVFLAYYPAIMSYDSHRQFNEAYNNFFWEIQPISHTFMIQTSMKIGEKLGSLETGMAIYSILQMLILSVSLAYLNSFIYKISKNIVIISLTIVFYAFLPITSVLSITVTKDVLFTAFFLILSTALLEKYTTSIKYPIIFNILIVISASLMMLFRKNGLYGFLAFCFIVVISQLFVFIRKDTSKKELVKKSLGFALICVISLVVGFLSIKIVRLSLNAGGDGPVVEKYSVPIQQFARIAYYHYDELDEKDREIINTYLPGFHDNPQYSFSLADAPKSQASGYAFEKTGTFAKDWVHMVINYPEDCIDAYLGLIAGYFFTDDIAISRYLGYGRDNMRGLLETFNALKPGVEGDVHIESVSKLPKLQYFIEGIVSNEEYLKYPVIPILFRPAFYIWIAITCFSILIYKKRYQVLLVSSIQIAYFCTVLLGPVANIRYALQVILAVPLLITLAFIRYTPALPPVGNTNSSSNTGASPVNSEK